jgi:hypothetical protein
MMKAKSFAYDERLIASCASSSDVRFVPLRLQDLDSDDAVVVPTLDIDVNRVPHNNACRTLLEQHAQHYYGRPLTTTDHDDARIIRRFLESVLLLHDFNNRHSQRSLAQQHKAVNHQSFANGKNNNHPLKPAPPEEEWLQLWKDEDWESRSLGEAFLVRLHNEDSIQKALAFHFSHHDANSTRRQLRTHHHHHRTSLALPFDSYSPSLKIAQDYNFRETDISSSSSKKHSHKDSQEDPFSTLLNWATDQNPDGVPIVHQVHDQVRRRKKKSDTHTHDLCVCVVTTVCTVRTMAMTHRAHFVCNIYCRVRADRVGLLLPLAHWRPALVVV